uniref:Uncharacterized protein n=1 Tax=Trichogramma kaykai TaxID=54128 RepID=A0ABD2X7B6_9HYME
MPGLPLIHRECGARVLSLPEVQRRKRETTLPAPRGHDARKYHQAHARERAELRRKREPHSQDVADRANWALAIGGSSENHTHKMALDSEF